MNLLLTFVILNIVNVVLQTIKSLATVKCGKAVAAIVNALAYGLYTYVIIYTNADLPMFTKACVVALTNLIGVYIVKALEEKMRKDKLWKIEITVPNDEGHYILGGPMEKRVDVFEKELKIDKISYNKYDIDKDYVGFNVYTKTQEESLIVKNLVNRLGCKYFASECKIL